MCCLMTLSHITYGKSLTNHRWQVAGKQNDRNLMWREVNGADVTVVCFLEVEKKPTNEREKK